MPNSSFSEYGLDNLSIDKNGAVWAAGKFRLSCTKQLVKCFYRISEDDNPPEIYERMGVANPFCCV